MLILDKRKDIAVLYSIGADSKLIRKIFLTEGMMVSFSGAIAGMILGALVCLIQQRFGLVKINTEGGSFLIDAYPVVMQGMDFLYIFLIVSAIGFMAAWLPVRNAGKVGSLTASLHSK
jgi:lipoprotein-releasing system permease protein